MWSHVPPRSVARKRYCTMSMCALCNVYQHVIIRIRITMPPGLPPWHSARGLPLPGGGHLPHNWQAYPQHCRPHTSTGSLTNIFFKKFLGPGSRPGQRCLPDDLLGSVPGGNNSSPCCREYCWCGAGRRQTGGKQTNKQTILLGWRH